jgi:hypothetical protein
MFFLIVFWFFSEKQKKTRYTCAFGPVKVAVSSVTATWMTCFAPPWYLPHEPTDFTLVPLSVVSVDNYVISNFTYHWSYYPQPVVSSLLPNRGNTTGGVTVRVMGEGFLNTYSVWCQFGDNPSSSGTVFRNVTTEVNCVAPPWSFGQPASTPVEVSLNGFDFTDNDVLFHYDNVPILVRNSVFFLWKTKKLMLFVTKG